MNTEKRINLKFLVRLGKTPLQAFEMLQQVYGKNIMLRKRVFEKHKKFKERQGELKNYCRSGRLSTSRTEVNIERVRQVVDGSNDHKSERHKNDCVWKIITEDWKVTELGVQSIRLFLAERNIAVLEKIP